MGMTSVFACGVNEVFALVQFSAALISSYLPKVWDSLSVSSSSVNGLPDPSGWDRQAVPKHR